MSELFAPLLNFHFLRPYWLLAIPPSLFLTGLFWFRKDSFGAWHRVISPQLLPHLMGSAVTRRARLPLILLLSAWILACLAIAGPTWEKLPMPAQKRVHARVIVLDLSQSMYAKDLTPSRLVRARMKLSDILDRSSEGITALVVYSGSPHVVTPLTDDTNTILNMINSLTPEIMPIQGSNPIAALERAVGILKTGSNGIGQILLITDSLPEDFIEQASPLLSSDTPLSILGVGTAQGAPIERTDGTFVKNTNGTIVIPKMNDSDMKRAAQRLGGRFAAISTNESDIDYLIQDHLFTQTALTKTQRDFDVWDDNGHWIALLILPLAALGYRKGWLGTFLLPLLLLPAFSLYSTPSHAFGWQDLWQTPDQQAQALLDAGDSKQAAETFQAPDWKGISQYRSGDFAAAENTFQELEPTADNLYNLGNARARQNKLEDAIAAYQQALEKDPDLKDAQSNLDIVKKLLQQQQNDNQQQNNDDQNPQQDQDQNQNKQEQSQQQDGQDQSNQSKPDDPKDNQSQSKDHQQDDNAKSQEKQPKQSGESKEENEQKQPLTETDPKQPPDPAESQLSERSEDQDAMEQWLRRVPDDPGGLLRRKFQLESQTQKRVSNGDTTW